jgi:FdhD protein
MSAALPVQRALWRDGVSASAPRLLAEETAVALTYNRTSYAVMMATPADLEDFAAGFSLSEGLIFSPGEIQALDIIERAEGLELRMDLPPARIEALHARQRWRRGASGCGLCGMESLQEATRRPVPITATLSLLPAAIQRAQHSLPAAQQLNRQTGAAHAAALCDPAGRLLAVCEDVGRHNALDKLIGRVARLGLSGAAGFLLLTSRISTEMVQKAAVLGCPVVVAMSAPTAHAVRLADEAGMTLVGVARDDGFEVFTHPRRIALSGICQDDPVASGLDGLVIEV